MIRDIKSCKIPEADVKKKLKKRRLDLAGLQQTIKKEKLPVIVLVEGWGASGKGSLIRSLIRELDPRFFTVRSPKVQTEGERRWPFLKRYFDIIPEKGKILFLDSSWMDGTMKEYLGGDISDGEYVRRIKSTEVLERQLTNDGYLIVKLFLHISQKTQRERLRSLEGDRDTSWRVSRNDWRQNKNYQKTLNAFDDYLEKTNFAWAPWKVIESEDGTQAQLEAADWLYEKIQEFLLKPAKCPPPAHIWDMRPEISLAGADLTARISKEEYEKQLDGCRDKLEELHNELYRKKVPVTIVYEGWDAAGKGGNIKRLTSALDPRGYEVHPIASPTPEELSRHYLWRFWSRIPKTGHIAVFDRSWYGRVMVERIEGFCREEEWRRAYDEINEFEQELTDSGMVVVKFWVHIDKDTQLVRFKDRENTPEKRWKITEEDWRNREKWDEYETAVNEMLKKTNTKNAPWYILESVDKRYARIKAMKTVIKHIEDAL